MNHLLFIRHAETDMAGTFCGHSDPPINPRGYQQIQDLLSILHSEKIDIIYTSDLQRAATTAGALAEAFTIPCVTKPNLREINFGEWEGFTWQEIQQSDAAYANKWIESYPDLPAPSGESLEAFQTRVLAEVTDLLNLADHEQAAVVTHAGVMRVVLQIMCGLDEQEAWNLTKPYCCFFKYPYSVAQ